MQKFMLLIREDLKKLKRSTDAELNAELQEMLAWTKEIASSGNLIATEPLEVTGRYVTKKKGTFRWPIHISQGRSSRLLYYSRCQYRRRCFPGSKLSSCEKRSGRN